MLENLKMKTLEIDGNALKYWAHIKKHEDEKYITFGVKIYQYFIQKDEDFCTRKNYYEYVKALRIDGFEEIEFYYVMMAGATMNEIQRMRKTKNYETEESQVERFAFIVRSVQKGFLASHYDQKE